MPGRKMRGAEGVTPWPQLCLHGIPETETCAECGAVATPTESFPGRAPVPATPWELIVLTPSDSQYTRTCDKDDCLTGLGRYLFARYRAGKRERRVFCLTDGRAFAKRNHITMDGCDVSA